MTQMVLENVEVLWPRINQPYRFVRNAAHPNGKGDQQPCGHLEPNAAYTLTMRLTGEQTKMLWAKMKEAYNNDKSPTWAAEPENRFKKDKDKETGEPNGYYRIQAGKKA